MNDLENKKLIELLTSSVNNLSKVIELLVKEEDIEKVEKVKESEIVQEVPEKMEVQKVQEIQEEKPKKPIVVDFDSVDPFGKKVKEEPKIEEKIPETSIPTIRPKHSFPDCLYHSSGVKLTPYEGVPIYQPDYILGPNQAIYGVQDEWNVVVNYENGKYITQHPQDHFNNAELKETL